MNPEDCKRFESCNANLCPLEESILKKGNWFSDEEICSSLDFSSEPWIKNQKRIAKKSNETDTCYTYRMLKRNCVIRKGITGIGADLTIDEIENAEEKWLKEHPAISNERREELSQKMKKVRKSYCDGDKSI
ncbi:MAG: hypothetical protein JXA60_12100 [Candidatus Coatesbacteria bacterium]|nr:hypothetical protein [Candidatus Coatesbacteria bacterium]